MELDPATLRVGQRVRVVSGFGGEVTGTILHIEDTMNGMRVVTLDQGEPVLAPAPGDPMPMNRFFPGRAPTPPPKAPTLTPDTTPQRIRMSRGARRRKPNRRKSRKTRRR